MGVDLRRWRANGSSRSRLRLLPCVLVAALLVLLAPDPAAALAEDFYLFTLSEGGQYEGSRSDPISRSQSDANSRLGPFETTIRLDPVEERGLGWFAGDAVAEWHRKMDLFWAALDQDQKMFSGLEGVDLSELPADGRGLTESLREQWRLTIEPRIQQHEALEARLLDVELIQRVISGLRYYRHRGTVVQMRFSGGAWTRVTRDEAFVYETAANAEGWFREQRPGGEHWNAQFAAGTKLLVWRFDLSDMRRIAELMADWTAVDAAIGPQRDRLGQEVRGSAEVQGRQIYGGDSRWFQRFLREGLEIVMAAAWTLTPHPLPERLRVLHGNQTQWVQDAPLQIEPLTVEKWAPPALGKAEPPAEADSGPSPSVDHQFLTIDSFRQAVPPGTRLELPPISAGTLMRLETTHSPTVNSDFRVEGRRVQTGDGYRDERRIDGVYRPWDSVDAIPSPVPLPWQVLAPEQRRAQLNATTGTQATNFTSPKMTGWGYLDVNGEVPDDALVGELINHWITDYGETFRTQLAWQLLHNGKAPEIAKEKMDLRIVRFVEGEFLPIDGTLDFGAHFYIEGRLEEAASREAYVVSFALPDGEVERAVLTPTEEDRRLLRSEMHYLIWETSDPADAE